MYIDTKLRFIFKKFNKNEKKINFVVEYFIKNLKYNKIKKNINLSLVFYKNTKKLKNKICFCIVLEKKQTFVVISLNNLNLLSLSNGVILKKNNIFKKSKKKEEKSSILNINTSINFLKKKIDNNNKNILIINVKKIKSFISKINKIFKKQNKIKNNFNKRIFLVTPMINFFKTNFKKIKSIKRRSRKKYKILN